jgi:hypothetical protein
MRCVAARERPAARRFSPGSVAQVGVRSTAAWPLRSPSAAPERGEGLGFVKEGQARMQRTWEARAGLHCGALRLKRDSANSAGRSCIGFRDNDANEERA